jgi:hypothetical protein
VSKHKVVSPRASASTPGSTKDGSVVGHFTTSSGQGQTTRGGLRVYKVVVLGDGGVGKSGVYKLRYIIKQKVSQFKLFVITLNLVLKAP